jgi:hypothetical protein
VVYLAKRRYDQRRDLLDRSALEKLTIHGLDHETRLDGWTRLRGPTIPHPPHDAFARLVVDVDVQTQRVARVLRDELARRDLEPEIERALRGSVDGEVPEQTLDLVVPVWVCEQSKYEGRECEAWGNGEKGGGGVVHVRRASHRPVEQRRCG